MVTKGGEMLQPKCGNFMFLNSMNATVQEHDAMWGHPDEPTDEITFMQMLRICNMCDFGDPELSALTQVIMEAAGDIVVKVQKEVIRLTGKPMKRKCYKEVK